MAAVDPPEDDLSLDPARGILTAVDPARVPPLVLPRPGNVALLRTSDPASKRNWA